SLRADDRGPLWEHLVLDTLVSVEDQAKVFFWRDHQDREIDFVVARSRDAVDSYECKWKPSEQNLKNLRAFREAYPHGANFLVVPDTSARRTLRRNGLEIRIVSPVDLIQAKRG